MKKWSICRLAVILIISTLNKLQAQQAVLLKQTLLPDYPSASGIIFYNGNLFVMGDDAKSLIILDTTHRKVDSVLLFPMEAYRIPWDQKPDMESLMLAYYKKNPYLISLSSFSSSIRNKAAIVPLRNLHMPVLKTLPDPGQALKRKGIQEVNFEGSTVARNKIIISNRANLSHKINYLVVAKARRNAFVKPRRWHSIAISLPAAHKGVLGISGLEYWKEKDILLFTASSEATTSANQDGEIGDSYMGLIYNFSRKLKAATLPADKLINLSDQLKIGHQKLEGLCLQDSDNQSAVIHLAADNDDGRSIIYKISLQL